MPHINNLTISQSVNPRSQAFETEARSVLVEDGWGVFRHEGGFANLPSSTLVKVLAEEEAAEEEADRLNATDGKVVYEIDGDPETNVYQSTRFDAQRVALEGIAIRVQATYSLAGEEAWTRQIKS